MTAKRSIAFVANTSWSIYKFRIYLIKKLLEEGYTIFVLAPRDSYTANFETLTGLTYIELTHLKAKTYSILHNRLLRKELQHHYSRLKPDIIFHYTIKANIYGSIAARKTGIPSISVITGLGYTFAKKGWLRWAVQFLYKYALRSSAEVWFLNEDDRHVFTSLKLTSPEKTFLLPGEGVDTDVFFPAPYEQASTVSFLLIGRIIRHKGIYEFIQAAEQLRSQGLSISCQLLGFFDDDNPVAIGRQEVKEWSSSGLITYLGETDEVAPFIQQADCIVLPSYREGLPLSLLEGASMCKALIAADTAGCRALIDDGINGYLCREKDGADLAGKMAAYYHLSTNDKKQMGIAGRNKVLSSFTQEKVADIYLKKIQSFRLGAGNKN